MYEVIKFTIPGEPVAQGRPRFNKNTGRAFDPGKSKDYKSYIKLIASQNKPKKPLEGPISVDLNVYRSIPSSWSEVKKKKARNFEILPTTKPDVDNVAKGVLDACTKIIWNDDNQIVELVVRKFYSDNPRIEIEVIK